MIITLHLLYSENPALQCPKIQKKPKKNQFLTTFPVSVSYIK